MADRITYLAVLDGTGGHVVDAWDAAEVAFYRKNLGDRIIGTFTGYRAAVACVEQALVAKKKPRRLGGAKVAADGSVSWRGS